MHHNQIFEIQDYYNPQMQRELFELIEKVYFHDFSQTPPSYEVEGAASFIDTSEFELKKLSLNCEAIETSTTDTNSEGVEMRLNKEEIEKRVKHLRVQLDVVGRKCSDIILQNSQAYSVELKRVSDFKGLLEDSYQICAIARRALAMSEFMFVVPSLKLVKKQLKKSHLVQLYTAVTEIKSFHNSTVHISELIKNREFSKAISLCMKNEKSMAKYEHLKCIKGLKKTVRDYYETIEENLESSLSKVCRNYDETLLDEIFTAYALLDKCEDFVDKLSLSTLNSVNLVAAETLIGVIVNAFVLSENLTSNTKENLVKVNGYIDELKKKEFNHLFNLISVNDYKSSLVNMCLNLWQIMKNYYRILVFTYNTCLAKSQTSPAINMEKLEPKLSSGLNKIWQDVQLKLSTYFRSMCFDHFKFDQFLDILTILNRFIELGHEFCNKNSNSRLLVDAAKDQTLAYFKAYHIMHLEELKMFLENETWQWCPVRSDFSIYKLQEYKFLKENSTNSRKNSKSTSRKQQTNGTGNGHKSKDLNLLNTFDDNNSISSEQQFDGTDNTATRRSSSSHHQKSSSSSSLMSNGSTLSDASLSRAKNSGAFEVNAAFMSLLKEENPIEKTRGRHEGEEGTDEASESEDDSEQIDENKNVLVRMKQEQMLNGHGSHHNDDGDVTNTNLSLSTSSSMNLSVGGLSNSNVPILTNTTLNVIRLFGKYIHMLSIFKIISQQVITYLMQLFQFYFYFIYLDFTQQEPDKEKESSNSTTNSSLQIIIKNIKNELFANSKLNITEPKISSIKAVYNREDYLECINQRIVAAESLIFLAHEIECLLPLITSYVPDASTIQSSLSTYQHMLGEISKIREPIYLFAANLAFDWAAMFESVSRVNWDLHDILSQHNPYVDMLLRQMQTMIVDIESLGSGEEAMRRLPMSRALVGAFVREALKLVMRRLVDAYASVKKCSNEGRALMQLDFQQLVVKLEKLCDVRPIPEKDYVEAYIKAFYLPDSSIEKWISDHSEYQPKHIVSLLNVMAQVTKKTRTSIITSFGNNIN